MGKNYDNHVTMRDIAARIDVSVTTVSKVINGHKDISEKTRQKVLDAIEEMHYTPNIMAANLRRNKGTIIGLVLCDISQQFFEKVIKGVEKTLEENGYWALIFNSTENPEREVQLVKQLVSNNVAGFIINPSQNSDPERLKSAASGIPFVLSNRFYSAAEDYYVCADDYLAGKMATEFLLEHKPGKPVLCINGPDSISPTNERYAGYADALSRAGMTVKDEWVFNNNFGMSDAYKAGQRIIQSVKPPFSVFCSTDQLAIGFMRAVSDNGLRIPEDVAVIGVDDIEMDEYLSTPLTTVSLPKEEIGSECARMLLQLMEGKEVREPRLLLPPQIIVRGTV